MNTDTNFIYRRWGGKNKGWTWKFHLMLDSDLARLYECVNGTKTINQAVNRHLDRFPNDFYFQWTEEEYKSVRSQIGTLKNGRGQHKKYLSYVFTEQDITKYNKQYHNLKVIYDNTFHDRYFIIDNKIVYHCGTSINRIGYKTFSINLISDEEVCNSLISKVNKIITSIIN